MKKITIIVLLFALTLSFAPKVFADSPIGVALINPIQFPNKSESITGLRLNALYAKNQNVTGIDLGLFLPFNFVEGNLKGIQIGIYNKVKGNGQGIQWGFVNSVNNDFTGLQIALVNFCDGSFKGLQTGFFNQASKLKGVQWGFFNMTDNLQGLQIGLLNFKQDGGSFPKELPLGLFPILNWAF